VRFVIWICLVRVSDGRAMLKIHMLEHMSNYEEDDEAQPETGGTGSSSPSISSDSSSATLSAASQQG
jgi:hypothetical protein